jgi:hypothetical protein
MDKCVVAFDLATTRLCVAYGTTSRREGQLVNTKVYKNWTSSRETVQNSYMPITAIYYNDRGSLITGNVLQQLLTTPEEINNDRYFPFWKRLYHDEQDDPSAVKIQEDYKRKLRNMGKSRKDLLRDWVAYQYHEIFQKDIEGRVLQPVRLPQGHDDRNFLLEIVVAVPPGRTFSAHNEIMEGFKQFGISAKQISLVSEPEAMFRAWVALDGERNNWKVGQCFDSSHIQDRMANCSKVGKRYLVCDGGGGTLVRNCTSTIEMYFH